MNWLRKIGNWLWLNKERMVLAVMVSVLIFRVYQVLNPDPGGGGDPVMHPGSELPDDKRPGVPSPPPPPPTVENWTTLWRANPFVWRQPRVGGRPSDRNAPTEELGLEFLSIREVEGTLYANIRTNRAGWYKEGDKFEQFELLTIDPDTECITVFAEELQKPVEVCRKEPNPPARTP